MLLAPPKLTPTSLFTAALLAFPALGVAADAQAASAPSVRVTAVSSQVAGGTVSLKVQNRSKAKVAGKVSAKAGKASAGRAAFKVKRRATARIALRLSADARRKLATDSRLRLSLVTTVKGKRIATSAVTLTPRKPGGSTPQGTGQPGAGGKSESPNWAARTGASGAYDDFGFTLAGGQINLTQRPLATLQCSENGGNYHSYSSWEVFGPAGPWTLGAQSQEVKDTVPLANLLAGSSPHTARYQLRSSRSGNTISGQLYMSAAWSNYDVFENEIVFVNCFGTTPFEAVQQ